MAAAERRLSEIKYWSHVHFRESQITEFMILCVAWTLLVTLFRMTLPL